MKSVIISFFRKARFILDLSSTVAMLNIQKILRRSKRKLVDRSVCKPNANSPTKKPKAEPTPTKITDVNVDCLERIFEHLDVTALNNVADAHPNFITAARLIFQREHSSKTLRIFHSTHMISLYEEHETAGHIVNATATSFLQNFGDLVRKLRLDYSQNVLLIDDRHHWRATERVIFEHCTKTLTSIELINCRGNVLEEICQPFEKVNKVYVYDITAKSTTTNLSKWFPNTRRLELQCGAVSMPNYAKGEFRVLDKLRLLVLNLFHNYRRDETNIREFLRTNHHITNISIESKFVTWLKSDLDFLSFINKTMTQLQKLRWVHMKLHEVKKPKRIHFKHVESLELQATGEFPENVSITFDRLKSLKLYQMNGIDGKWNDFIVQNKDLVELGYFPSMHCHQQSADELLAITTKLPKLNAIYLQAHIISPQNLGQFLTECTASTNVMTLGLNFFAGFKSDLADYLSVVNKRYLKLKLESVSGYDRVILQRIEQWTNHQAEPRRCQLKLTRMKKMFKNWPKSSKIAFKEQTQCMFDTENLFPIIFCLLWLFHLLIMVIL